MPRVIKHPEIRRAEILDAAFAMFIERGYDNTSLNDIISGAGLSKGMFYHHFASKETLLGALFDRITEQSYAALEPIVAAPDLDPKRRLREVLVRGAEIRLRSVEFSRGVFASLLRPENQYLYHRIQEAWVERMRLIFGKIIADGVEAGVFATENPQGAADLILEMQRAGKRPVERGALATTTRERNAAAADLDRLMKFHGVLIGRMLGLPDETFTVGPSNFARKFLAALNPIADKPVAKQRRAVSSRTSK